MQSDFTYPDKLLHELFVEQAYKTPHRIALIDAPPDGVKRSLTYAELDAKTDALAFWLRYQGVTTNSIIPIYMNRCLEYAICYIAILKAGGAYLPLEVGYPKDMLNRVIKETSPVVILTVPEHIASLPEDSKKLSFTENYQWESNITLDMNIIC